MPVSPPASIQSKPLRIFVVEDHLDTANSVRMFLESLGHTVLCATSMGWALEELPRAGCDVLLCDIKLPDGDGWDLLSQVKGRLARPTYAVAMSAHTQPIDHAKSRDAGFYHHLDKPIDPMMLIAVLNQAAGALSRLARNGDAF